MMLRFLFIFLLGSWAFLSVGQSYEAHISGSISYENGEKVEGVTVTLFEENDSISSTKSNKLGEFFLEVELFDKTEYYLMLVEGMPEFLSKDKLLMSTEMYRTDFVFDLVYPTPRIDQSSGQVAFYAANETKKFTEFEVEQILRIITKYPNVCIEFSQTILRSENEKIAKKRKINFLKFLQEAGVDISCVRFNDRPRILQAVNEDQRARIQGAIASLESKCE